MSMNIKLVLSKFYLNNKRKRILGLFRNICFQLTVRVPVGRFTVQKMSHLFYKYQHFQTLS